VRGGGGGREGGLPRGGGGGGGGGGVGGGGGRGGGGGGPCWGGVGTGGCFANKSEGGGGGITHEKNVPQHFAHTKGAGVVLIGRTADRRNEVAATIWREMKKTNDEVERKSRRASLGKSSEELKERRQTPRDPSLFLNGGEKKGGVTFNKSPGIGEVVRNAAAESERRTWAKGGRGDVTIQKKVFNKERK